jgi:MFS family permease
MVSFYFITRLKEPLPEETGNKDKPVHAEPLSLNEILSHSKKILKVNLNFKYFLIADALILMSLTASAFYPVYGIKKFDLPASYAGTFTIILMASQVVGNFFFGYLADFFGHKINVLILALCSAAASLTAVIADNVLLYGIVFFFTGCTLTLQGISRLAIVVEMCTESERPFYIGLFNSLTAPTILFGIIGGVLVTIIGYIPVFLIYTFISLIAFYWLYKRVKEPRH